MLIEADQTIFFQYASLYFQGYVDLFPTLHHTLIQGQGRILTRIHSHTDSCQYSCENPQGGTQLSFWYECAA